MNININTSAVLDDAKEVDSIISAMNSSLEVLTTAVRRYIPDGVRTDWSDSVRSNWEKYYSADVPAALNDMQLSATNLRKAVDESLKYSQQ